MSIDVTSLERRGMKYILRYKNCEQHEHLTINLKTNILAKKIFSIFCIYFRMTYLTFAYFSVNPDKFINMYFKLSVNINCIIGEIQLALVSMPFDYSLHVQNLKGLRSKKMGS